jgi:FkbM family methyltransferase
MYKEYLVGKHILRLPQDHLLDTYQLQHKRYDTNLAYIAKEVFSKYPRSCSIDIGANIGSTAALIQEHQQVKVLCIEGNPEFLEYLDFNASVIGNIVVEKCFVGKDNSFINLQYISSRNGTASIISSLSNSDLQREQEQSGCNPNTSQVMRSLSSILQKHNDFRNAKLLKIDTDGYDFIIIQQSIDIILELCPVIYFEYDISFDKYEGCKVGLETIDLLISKGYNRFIVYDNYGNYLISLSDPSLDSFVDLNSYLVSNHFKSNNPAIYYLDICAFSDKDRDLFDRIRNIEISYDLLEIVGTYEKNKSVVQPLSSDEIFKDKKGTQSSITEMLKDAEDLRNIIASMEKTKFWKLRTKWLKIKNNLRKTTLKITNFFN